MEHVLHTLLPVFDKNSKILILGSIPSPKSRETGFYYGHSQNRFWKVLAKVFNCSVPITNEEKSHFVLERGIALWDVIASCNITGASDSSIKNAIPNDFNVIFNSCKINAVFTTGKTANSLYKKFTKNSAILLPSPSPANCAVSFDKLVESYKIILKYL